MYLIPAIVNETLVIMMHLLDLLVPNPSSYARRNPRNYFARLFMLKSSPPLPPSRSLSYPPHPSPLHPQRSCLADLAVQFPSGMAPPAPLPAHAKGGMLRTGLVSPFLAPKGYGVTGYIWGGVVLYYLYHIYKY